MLWRLKIVPQIKAGRSEIVFNSPFSPQKPRGRMQWETAEIYPGQRKKKKKRGLKECL